MIGWCYCQSGKAYIALNSETYILVRQQELGTCKGIGYKFYCKELFMVKHKFKYSCESAIYFDSSPDIIKGKLKICILL